MASHLSIHGRNVKVEKILKDRLYSIPSLSLSVKIQIMGGKDCLSCKGRTLLGVFYTNFWEQKVCWNHPAMFCLITSSKLSRQWFEFSLVMGSNPGYLLKYFLLYHWIKLGPRLYGGQNLGVVIPVAPVVASLLFCLMLISWNQKKSGWNLPKCRIATKL